MLFDFDGVIVNSEPLHFYAFHKVLEAEGIELSEEEYYRELIGFDDRGAFRHLFEKRKMTVEPERSVAADDPQKRSGDGADRGEKYHALPGVEEFVRGIVAALSAGDLFGALREEIEAMLEGVALRDCFIAIVAAEDVTVGKARPAGICAVHGSRFRRRPGWR